MPNRSTDDPETSPSSTEWVDTDEETHSSAQYTLSSPSFTRLWGSLCGLFFSLWTTVGPSGIPATDTASSTAVDAMDSQTRHRDTPLFSGVEVFTPDDSPVGSTSYSDHPLLGVDPGLLNPERRILQLLLVEGGALAQAEIVDRTRWSDSTISRTLCRMEAQERIARRQDGSGKLVILPQSQT